MKKFYFQILIAAFSLSFALQAGLLAQSQENPKNQSKHQLDVQMQRLPAGNEENENARNVPQNEKTERTLSILKPDALKNGHIGDIISRFEKNGLHIAGMKMTRLSPEQASQFYNVHRDRPFFNKLVQYMSSGPVIILVLEGNQAISKNRALMGATDPQKAEMGTIRADFAESVTENAVHGSDSPESAQQEIQFFFKPQEIFSESASKG